MGSHLHRCLKFSSLKFKVSKISLSAVTISSILTKPYTLLLETLHHDWVEKYTLKMILVKIKITRSYHDNTSNSTPFSQHAWHACAMSCQADEVKCIRKWQIYVCILKKQLNYPSGSNADVSQIKMPSKKLVFALCTRRRIDVKIPHQVEHRLSTPF